MAKQKVMLFQGSESWDEYHGRGLNLKQGDIFACDEDIAKGLVEDFPKLFRSSSQKAMSDQYKERQAAFKAKHAIPDADADTDDEEEVVVEEEDEEEEEDDEEEDE